MAVSELFDVQRQKPEIRRPVTTGAQKVTFEDLTIVNRVRHRLFTPVGTAIGCIEETIDLGALEYEPVLFGNKPHHTHPFAFSLEREVTVRYPYPLLPAVFGRVQIRSAVVHLPRNEPTPVLIEKEEVSYHAEFFRRRWFGLFPVVASARSPEHKKILAVSARNPANFGREEEHAIDETEF